MAPSKPAKWLVVEDSETITGSAILNSPDHKQDSTAKQSECTSSKGGGRSGLFPPRPTENGFRVALPADARAKQGWGSFRGDMILTPSTRMPVAHNWPGKSTPKPSLSRNGFLPAQRRRSRIPPPGRTPQDHGTDILRKAAFPETETAGTHPKHVSTQCPL